MIKILDPRRRFRDRLLIGMVAVALLPLVLFAVLAAIDLDAIGKSTAEAAQGAILQDEQARQQSTVAADAGLIDQSLVGINSALVQLQATLAGALNQRSAAPAPAGMRTSGSACYTTGTDSIAVLPCASTERERALIAASGPLVGQMQALRHDHPEVESVWVANQGDTAVRAVPAFDVPSALVAGRLDPTDSNSAYRLEYLTGAKTRFSTRAPGWTPPGTPSTGSGPFWTDPYPLLSNGVTGVTAWLALPGGGAVGADLTLTGLVTNALASSASTPLPPASYPLLLSSDGLVLYAGRGLSFDFDISSDPTGSPLPIAPTSSLAQHLKRVESNGTAKGPLTASLAGVQKDIFTAPVYAGRWILARPVPVSDLQPDITGLTAGVTSGVHHLFPLLVLPALLLLLVVAFMAATLLSRRLVGPVRHLRLAAERLARGETDVPVPAQGSDEVGVLAASLEQMRKDVNSSREAIMAAAAELELRVAQRTQELRTRNDELVALNDLAGSLTRSLEPQWILADALQAIRAIHSLQSGCGYVLEGESLNLVAVWPEEDARNGHSAHLDALAASVVHRRRPAHRRLPDGELLAWPLATQQGVVGAIAARASTGLDGDKRRLLQAVADQVALALRTSLLSAAGREHAVLEERTRLAREIHDTLAQQLTAIVIQLEAAGTLVERGSERAGDSVETARELSRAALQEARRSVWNLRPAPLAATGLVAALEREVRAWEARSGIRARFRTRAVPARPPLQPAAEVALLRTLQEALSNVARHSGAKAVDVRVRSEADEVVLSVRDNGVGFDVGAEPPRPDCFGLEGMRQRVRLAGGTLTVVSAPKGGTEVTARLPLAEAAAVAHTA